VAEQLNAYRPLDDEVGHGIYKGVLKGLPSAVLVCDSVEHAGTDRPKAWFVRSNKARTRDFATAKGFAE
jgi:hypothetical protein